MGQIPHFYWKYSNPPCPETHYKSRSRSELQIHRKIPSESSSRSIILNTYVEPNPPNEVGLVVFAISPCYACLLYFSYLYCLNSHSRPWFYESENYFIEGWYYNQRRDPMNHGWSHSFSKASHPWHKWQVFSQHCIGSAMHRDLYWNCCCHSSWSVLLSGDWLLYVRKCQAHLLHLGWYH